MNKKWEPEVGNIVQILSTAQLGRVGQVVCDRRIVDLYVRANEHRVNHYPVAFTSLVPASAKEICRWMVNEFPVDPASMVLEVEKRENLVMFLQELFYKKYSRETMDTAFSNLLAATQNKTLTKEQTRSFLEAYGNAYAASLVRLVDELTDQQIR